MIVAIVDDLMFGSKIRATAERLGRPVTFVRSAADALATIRAQQPALVIVDLDRASLDPINTIRAIKAEPDLAGIRIVGFVSHVQTAAIDAARHAGTDTVLARSAFVATLPGLIASTGN